MPYLSVSQAKYNKLEKELRAGITALEQENERLKSLLSEDLAAENAKLKLNIWEMECAIPKVKADAIRDAVKSLTHANAVLVIKTVREGKISQDMANTIVNHLTDYADQLEQGK